MTKGATRTAIDALSRTAIINVCFPPFLLTEKMHTLKIHGKIMSLTYL